MNKTFSTMKSNIGGFVLDTSTAFATKIGKDLNNRYFDILKRINWRCIRDDYTFNTVAGTRDYVLPEDFGKEIYVVDTTNKKDIVCIDIEDMSRYYASSILTSDRDNPSQYAILEDNVRQQPSSSSTLSIVSSSTSDITQCVYIRGIDSNGAEVSECVTLNGTTAQTSSNTYSRIKQISKDTITTGYVTITAGSVTVAVLSHEVLTAYYKKIRFHKTPSGIVTISLPYIIKPLPMRNDEDYPIVDISDIIEKGALADAWARKRHTKKSTDASKDYEVMIMNYIFDLENQPNKVTQFKPTTFDRDKLV